jgi:hypothetical protein
MLWGQGGKNLNDKEIPLIFKLNDHKDKLHTIL